jgi:hypothetical protein
MHFSYVDDPGEVVVLVDFKAVSVISNIRPGTAVTRQRRSFTEFPTMMVVEPIHQHVQSHCPLIKKLHVNNTAIYITMRRALQEDTSFNFLFSFQEEARVVLAHYMPATGNVSC